MAKYQFYFETQSGEVNYGVQIEDHETLNDVLNDILNDLRDQHGHILAGEGNPQVVAAGRILDWGVPLPQQGVKYNEVVRVSLMELNG